MPETVASLLAAHRTHAQTPAETVARSYARIRAYDDPALFISLRDEADAIAEARRLSVSDHGHLPLFGIPVAVKDNIDVAGLPTTSACPDFSYKPARDATAVARLRAAGAIIIGKTNLDQFATGLVGVRSPYGTPRNALRADLIPGGSSSGSAVAVAAGLVPIALGTDTAGSGRVPAMLNNIVGIKPSVGLISNAGMVPACRTIDCVSVFALTVDDASAALRAMAGHDPADPFSRRRPLAAPGGFPDALRIGVPRDGQLMFFGDRAAADSYDLALARLETLGARFVEFDLEPFYEAARLLYEGPWVAERYLTVRDLLASSPQSIHPVTREIILPGARATAADAFAAFYRLEGLRRASDKLFGDMDMMVLPTAPTTYTVEQVLANPIELNSRLGTYTNFVNLLDLCGLAVPATLRDDRTPFGITLLAPGGNDGLLASVGRVLHAAADLPLGSLDIPHPPLAGLVPTTAGDEIPIAVVGAHLSGMALNGELRSLGGRLLETASTSNDYRLYALKGTVPPKPGMVRVEDGTGVAIAIEIWGLSAAAFGAFVAAIPPPLSIGSVRVADGRTVKGFLAEPLALEGARDISQFGGWRAFIAAQAATA